MGWNPLDPVMDTFGDITGASDAANAAKKASKTQADYQNRGLDYLMSQEADPTYYRNQALDQIGGFYGIAPRQPEMTPEQVAQQSQQDYNSYNPEQQALYDNIQGLQGKMSRDTGGSFKYGDLGRMGHDQGNAQIRRWQSELDAMSPQQASQVPMQGVQQPNGQQAFIDQVQASPFYQQNIQQGEEASMRNAMMTGGMRGGNIQEGLAQNSQNVLQDLTNQRLQGLGGLANLPSNANNIAQQQSNIGTSLAGGQLAAGQQRAQTFDQLVGIAGAAGGFI